MADYFQPRGYADGSESEFSFDSFRDDPAPSTPGLDLQGLNAHDATDTFEAAKERRRSRIIPLGEKAAREIEKATLRVRRNQDWGVEPEKYWLQRKTTRAERLGSFIVWGGIALGVLAFIGFGIWGYFEARMPQLCMLQDEDFRDGVLNPELWQHEISSGGGHVGSFDWTTSDEANSFIKDGKLHLRPTFTQDYPDMTTINLTADGVCTDPYYWCNMTQNSTAGTVINPVQSAKISAKIDMHFGSLKIRAKMPRGDWIFSQISLEPSTNDYGSYPANGQIMLAQNRGNGVAYGQGGADLIDSYVNYGPDGVEGFGKTLGSQKQIKFETYQDGFHTYGVDWTPSHLRTWIDDPTNTVALIQWNKFGGFWQQGGWQDHGADYVDGIFNPWAPAFPSLGAPFDKPFHLTMHVGVGGMNGIFKDQVPWTLTAGRQAALKEFSMLNASTMNWPENEDRDLIVDWIKMEQQCLLDPLYLWKPT